MQLKTYNEILTELCDDFDSLISPRSIARTNTNIIYLIFKAVAKGYEVINNVCVTLSNKFDPESCSEDDLDSVASLVGTERLAGSSSGLYIIVKNSSEEDSKTLYAGTYTYKLDDDTSFTFDVLADTVVPALGTVTYIAMSTLVGSYPVTAQESITVTTTDVLLDSLFTFSCSDNSKLLGSVAETDTEFRKRILEDTTRQDSLSELQTTLRNLPYLFDARIKYNNTYNDVEYDGITIPPFYMLVFYSGEPKNEIAEKVAEKSIFPTVATDDSVEVKYTNDIFTEGYYAVNIVPFRKTEYTVNVNYTLNSSYATASAVQAKISDYLKNNLNTMVHKDYIKESDVYDLLDSLNITGVEILNVDLKVDGESVDYVSVPLSRIPELTDVTFTEEE